MSNVGDALRNFFRWFKKNWLTLLISFIFALMLWNVLLSDTDPQRHTTISNITIALNGQSTLLEKGLTIVNEQDFYKRLKEASAGIKMPRSEFISGLTSDLRLWVDVSGITAEGTYNLPVHAQSDRGTVTSITPKYIEVSIEPYESRVIGIEYQVSGTLAAGYWKSDTPSLSTNVVTISGPRSVIRTVAKAQVSLNITGLTEKVSSSQDIVLLDANDAVVALDDIKLGTPNCIITLDIKPQKEVPVAVNAAIMGTPANGYEVKEVVTTPDKITIVGTQAILDTITSLAISPIDIEGAKENKFVVGGIQLPGSLTYASASEVNITIRIGEKLETLNFQGLQIEIRNVPRALSVKATSISTANASVICTALKASTITEGRVKLYVDASGLAAGTHKLIIRSEAASFEGVTGVTTDPGTLEVTLQ